MVLNIAACQIPNRQPAVANQSESNTETPIAHRLENTRPLTAEQQIVVRLSTELGVPVMLVIERQRYNDGWHYYVGHPVNTDGSRIDISKTPFRKDQQDGYFDDVFMALFRQQAGDSALDLVEFSYGATDAPFIGWAEQHEMPRCLFSSSGACE